MLVFNPIKRLQIETSHFKTLSYKARTLILSFQFYELALPILSTFINAFIWRKSQGFTYVAIYNTLNFIALPLGFLLSGYLYKKVKIGYIYLSGLLIIGLSIISTIFLGLDSLLFFSVVGFIYGIGNGLFWANRNYLSFHETDDSQRNYFISIDSALATIISTVMPIAVGWFITASSTTIFDGIIWPYRIIAIIAMIFLVASGIILIRRKYDNPRVNTVAVKNVSPTWWNVRKLQIATGLSSGILHFVPDIIILSMLPSEKMLGVTNSVIAVIMAIALYLLGRLTKAKHRLGIFSTSMALFVLASILLVVLPHPAGFITYILVSSLGKVAQWAASYPLLLSLIEKEEDKNSYKYVFDMELFLNIGRILGVAMFMLVYSAIAPTMFIYAPLAISIVQIIIFSQAILSLKKLGKI